MSDTFEENVVFLSYFFPKSLMLSVKGQAVLHFIFIDIYYGSFSTANEMSRF